MALDRRIQDGPEVNSRPVGAAMVVGGGIAGMQSSLDLADQGYKVFLVEKQSAIGGKMAQLDKTFPTNDCAMCTISPKLVETGRHPNIEILTDTDVLEVNGQVGHFKVKVRQRPRYIKTDHCVACNDCYDVCPIHVPGVFDEGLADSRAVYKLYPQAVPNAYAINKAGIAPCRDACPAGQRAQGYIALIHEGRYDDAMRVIKMDNPFPGICGRICNHRCEDACNRKLVDEPINIRALKRFVTDQVYAQPRQPVESAAVTKEKPVAIIGAGPCGLTAAQDLALAGYPVTVFEAMPVAGGMLRLGVPEYRLPTEIIEREVQDILDLGVDLRLNTRINDLDDVFDQGFEAILIAVGAHEGIRLPIPGANLDGVLINTHFLRDVRLGKFESPAQPQTKERVVVLGGGNVAIDCARSAVRLGMQVEMACLESRETMPSHGWEIEAALAEGIIIHNDRTFERIVGDENDRVIGVECMKVESFSFDDAGRLNVEKVPGSKHLIECDTVVFSVGQRAGLAFLPDDTGVGLTDKKTVAINPNTFAATRAGVFAAGDSVSGTAFVIEAVDSGHKAAHSIIRYLEGEDLEPAPRPDLPVVKFTQQEIDQKILRGEIIRQARVPLPEIPVEDRITNFVEIECGYDHELAQAEAVRCLACGICSECMSCVFACQRDAIDHDMVAEEDWLDVGAIILAPGYQIYRGELSEEYGLGRYPNVVTSLQFERMLSASGPTKGHVRRQSDGEVPQRIAFLQCVGSRDKTHDYCSAVCCMYATKEACIAKEHHPGLDIDVFFMDMRAFSKGYWGYFERSKERYGINYIRSRVSMLREQPDSHNLLIEYQDEAGDLCTDDYDMVVLSVGMEISDSVKDLGNQLGIQLDEYGFCHTAEFNPLETSRKGIYAVGPFREPKDIPESVVEASGAAAAVSSRIAESRNTLTTVAEYPPERDQSDEAPRIGVFVCHCGSNIAGFIDVEDVKVDALGMPGVVHAETNLYTCSQDSVKHITETALEQGLNRVVVASCTPLTHKPLFQDSIRSAGMNKYLFEMANIRNQCSWVHSDDKPVATQKAKELVRIAAARAYRLQAQHTVELPVNSTGLVVGGGVAGMTASISLARQGFPVHLIEKSDQLGGNLRNVFTPSNGTAPQAVLAHLLEEVKECGNIQVHLNTQVVETSGFSGNFTTTIRNGSGEREKIEHGAVVLAIGGEEYRGDEYHYGASPDILTQQEFEQILHHQPEFSSGLRSVVMLQCVGPAEKYCSRICCTTALKNALALKAQNPDCQVIVLYKDIRSYGFKEKLYTEVREKGVVFVRYSDENPLQTSIDDAAGGMSISIWENSLKRQVLLNPDKLVLSMPVVPRKDAQDLAMMFKVPTGNDGFFLEAHVKLRPVDFPTEGVFMAGMVHYPKLIDESIIQAQAAAARAANILSQETITSGGRVALVDPAKCTGCLTCVRICPFSVPQIRADITGVGEIMGAAYIEASVCQGCGSCVAECPAHAIQLLDCTTEQMEAMVDALLEIDKPDIIWTEA
jgi:heterodisulfide reductase subunit A-like polyferredoxin